MRVERPLHDAEEAQIDMNCLRFTQSEASHLPMAALSRGKCSGIQFVAEEENMSLRVKSLSLSFGKVQDVSRFGIEV